jgi:ankyrin repeat protein
MQAAACEHTGITLALSSIGGARIDAVSSAGLTPLHWACGYGHSKFQQVFCWPVQRVSSSNL